jgi:hypothetical protein
VLRFIHGLAIKDDYTFYHDVDEMNINSTGVGILIRNDFNFRVIKVDSY